MFNVEDKVVYGKSGICTVTAIENIKGIDTYIINTDDANKMKFMIPVSEAQNCLRPMLDHESLDEMVAKVKNARVELILDFKERMQRYDAALSSGDATRLALLIKTINNQKNMKINLTMADKEILKNAEKLLYRECGLVLDMNNRNTHNYIFS